MKKMLSFMLVVTLYLSLSACGSPKTTNSAEGYIGTNYEAVAAELEDAGFTNIGVNEVQDLTSLSDLQSSYHNLSHNTEVGNSTFV